MIIVRFKKFLLYYWTILSMGSVLLSGNLIGNETSADSSLKILQGFNGIDYYSGWMVEGFGFGFSQYLEEKKRGEQTSATTPSIYYHLNHFISIEAFNKTAVKRIGANEQIDYEKNPIQNTTGLQFQVRPNPCLQFFPKMEFFNSKHIYNSHIMGELHMEDRINYRLIGLESMFISKGGKIQPSPKRLQWMHHLDYPVPLIQKDQIFLIFSGDFTKENIKGYSRDLADTLLAGSELSSEITDDSTSLEVLFGYGLTGNVGLSLKMGYYKDKNQLWNNDWEMDNYFNQDIVSTLIETEIHTLIRHNLFNQFAMGFSQYESQDRSENDFGDEGNLQSLKKPSRWSVQNDFHFLLNSYPPELEEFLANRCGIFDNRLSQREIHVHIPIFYFSEIFKRKGLFPSGIDDELKTQSLQFGLQIQYGLLDQFEMGFTTQFMKDRIYQLEQFDKTPIITQEDSYRWFERDLWKNTFSVEFSNFQYSERFRKKYGWYSMSSFDRRYGPLLLPGMLKTGFQWSRIGQRKSDSYFSHRGFDPSISDYNELLNGYVDNQRGWFNGWLACGLWGGFQLKTDCDFYDYSSKLRNCYDKDWRFNLTLSWQPWKTFRFEISQHSVRFVDRVFNWPDTPPFTHYLVHKKTENAWYFRLMGLF